MSHALVDLAMVALPKVAGGALTVALNVVLLRFLGPEQFGVYSLCVAAILLSDGILGTPFDMAVLRLAQAHLQDRPSRAVAMEQAAVWLKLVVIAVFALAGAVLARPIADTVFKLQGTAHLVPLCVAVVAGMLLLRSVLTHAQVRRRFAQYGGVDLIHILFKFGGIGLLLAVATPTPSMLLSFWLMGPLLAMLVGLAWVARPLARELRWRSADTGEVFAYAKWFLLTSALGSIMAKMDILMLGWHAPIEEVGIYSGAQVFALIPELLGIYMATVLSPRIVPSCRAGTFRRLFAKVQGLLLVGAVLAYLLAFVSWPVIADLLLPEAYRVSGDILLILLPGTLAGMVSFPLALAFVMFANKKLLLYMDLASFPFLVACYLLVLPKYGSVGAAWIATSFHLARTLIVQAIAWRWSRRPNPLKGHAG